MIVTIILLIMKFTDRTEAGKLLAEKLTKYSNEDIVIYALPRGGVAVAVEVAKALYAPLSLVISRKIGHPDRPEYAIAAVSEHEYLVNDQSDIADLPRAWIQEEIIKQRKEIKRRKETYLKKREKISPKGKTAIIIDDGIATGLTIRSSVKEIQHLTPKKIVVAVPVAPQSNIVQLRQEGNEVIALEAPIDARFQGAVGAYYDDFRQVGDQEVITFLEEQ